MSEFLEVEGSWHQYVDLARQLRETGGFVFRGQQDATWELRSSFERAKERWGFSGAIGGSAELRAVEAAAAAAYQFRETPPTLAPTEVIEWLAILQHYGFPTRLLDFTWSFFVAAWFAVSSAEGDSAIWCINTGHLAARRRRRNRSSSSRGELTADPMAELVRQFSDPDLDRVEVVGPIEAKIPSERLARQQGTFLVAMSTKTPFMTCLGVTLKCGDKTALDPSDLEPDRLADAGVVRLVVRRAERSDVLDDLSHMNIHAGSLFEGFAGFARSLERFISSEPVQRHRIVEHLNKMIREL